MKVIKIISVITLAAYLVFQGLYSLTDASYPAIQALIGILGLISGILMFISLKCWSNHHHDGCK